MSCATSSGQRRPHPTHLPETAIPAIRKTLAATAVAAAVLAVTAACGTAENLTAAQKLDQSVDKLGRQKAISLELGLDTDAATLKKLDSGSAPGKEMPDQVAQLLAGARVSLSVQSKKPLQDSSDTDITGMAVKVSGPDGDLLEYRQVGDWAYLRAGVKALEKASGSKLPAPGQLPPDATALKEILGGGWVKMPADSLTKNAPGTKETGPSGDPAADARKKKTIKGLQDLITREVQLKDTGTKDGADHITATASFKTLLTGLVDELRPLAGDLPPGANLPTSQDLKDAPDKPVTADFAIKNGALSTVSVDLAPLADTAKSNKFALVLRVGKGEQASAPDQAAQVDPGALSQQLLGGLAPQHITGDGSL
ncbi:hypothetical protein ACFRR6_02055 [Streptomyces sp. NPDC056891]|uniref:hypothetical protein n=1 Tax=Streptomyces sp. NPDC056891 TaxID=3345961 RepID=UPI003693109C